MTTGETAGIGEGERPRAELGLLTTVLIWGLNFTVMKVAVLGLDALVFNALRFSLSVLFLGLLLRRSGHAPELRSLLDASSWVRFLPLGLVGHFLYQTTFILGLERTTAGNSALLLASAPLWTALVGHVAGWEALRRNAWAGLAVAFAGTVLITAVRPDVDLGGDLGARALTGDVLALGAGMTWGAYTAMSKPFLPRWSSLELTWRSMVVAVPFLWLVALPRIDGFGTFALTPGQWGAVAYSGLLSTGVAYALWTVGVRHVGPSRTAVFMNLVPFVALAVGAVVLGERVTPVQVAGAALVIGGIAVMRRRR